MLESGHPKFRATSPAHSKEEAKEREITSIIHFNGSEETIELILRSSISVNQLSIYGAVGDLCKELSKDSEVAGKLAANED